MILRPLHLVPSNTSLDFLGKRWIAFVLSIALLLSSIGLLFTKGLNFGIDFTGGTVIELRTKEPLDLAKVRPLLNKAGLGDISLQTITEAMAGPEENDLMIRFGKQPGDNKDQLAAAEKVRTLLESHVNGEIEYRKTDFVGPQVGRELIEAGALSLGLALIAIMVYIWLRFEWQFGLGAIAALFHDTILTLGLFSLLQIEFNLTSIAAILTIIGYSINDSVVIFDRIRENLRKFKKKPLPDLLNLSINNTLSRTILTAGTTVVALVALVVFGGHVIYGFSLAVLFGVIIGTYSSVYIAAPILIFMDPRQKENGK